MVDAARLRFGKMFLGSPVVKSVLLIDDHPVIAVGVGVVLRDSRQFWLAGVVTSAAACVASVESHRPDALILDLVLDGVLQMSLIAQCRALVPDATIVVFSSLPERPYAHQAMSAGADAYVSKSTDLSTLLQFLGDIVPPPSAAPRSVPTVEIDIGTVGLALEGIHLTPRENEIARGLGRGLSIAAIAQSIGISANTVAVHRDNIRRKFDCRDTNELVARLARMEASADARR